MTFNQNDKNTYTIDDIAKALGVSKTTVSRTLSGKGRISESTRQRVLQFVEQHNYRPNAVAQSLAHSKTFNLGLVLPDNYHTNDFSFFQECMKGICEVASENDYDILIAMSGEQSTKQLERIIDNHKVDGIIVSRSIKDSPDIAILKSQNIPFVVIGYSPDPEILHMDNDNQTAARDLTALLITRGIQHPALLGGNESHYVTRSRLRGFTEAIRHSRLSMDDKLIFMNTDDQYSISRAIDEIIVKKSDCILCMDDLICSMAMTCLKDKGIRIPQEIQIASFYDSAILKNNLPAVTSLSFNTRALGSAACTLLLKQLSGGDAKSGILTGYQMIFRDSTK